MRRIIHAYPRRLSSPRRAACGAVLVLGCAAFVLSRSAAAPQPAGVSADAETARRTVSPFVYQTRQATLLWQRIQSQLAAGNVVTAMTAVQQVLDEPGDMFVWEPGRGKYVSLRSVAVALLNRVDANAFRVYLTANSADAEQLLSQFELTRDASVLREVGRRYFATPAGFEALNQLASRYLDAGEPGPAARIWSQLMNSRRHRERITPAIRVKAALAHAQAGNRRQVHDLLAKIPNQRVQAGGRSVPVSQFMSDGSGERAEQIEDWPTLLGATDRRRTVNASTPYLRTDWQSPLLESSKADDDLIASAFASWEKQQRDNRRPIAAANTPIVAGRLVIYRDFGNIVARRVDDGDMVWKYATASSLVQQQKRVKQLWGDSPVFSSRHGAMFNLQNGYAANSVLGTLSSDGRLVFAVDGMQIGPATRSNRFGNRGREVDANSSRSVNRLIALPIQTPASEKPTPAWVIDGSAKPGVDHPLSGHFFCGPPAVAQGQLYAITEAGNQIHLVVLNSETGALEWSQPLGYSDRPLEHDPNRYPLACPPAVSQGVVICPTHSGLIVGVDAAMRELLWTHVDADLQRRAVGRQWMSFRREPEGHSGFVNAPQVYDGRVVWTSRFSTLVQCLDIATGKLLWTQDRADGEYVGSVSQHGVLLVGQSHCHNLNVETGEVRWTKRVGLPSGRGIATADHYLLPLHDGRVATLELATGRELGLKRSRLTGKIFFEAKHKVAADGQKKAELPAEWAPGNLVAVGDRIISVDAQRIAVFPQSVAKLRTVRGRLKTNPDDISTKLLAAELELTLGKTTLAKAEVQSVLKSGPPADDRAQAERMLRELLYIELDGNPANEVGVLEQIEQLATTSAERGRFLVRKAELLLKQDDAAGMLQTAADLVALDHRQPIPVAGDDDLEVSASAYVTDVMRRMTSTSTKWQAFAPRILNEQQRVLANGGVAEMRQFLDLHGNAPYAAEVRLAYAERLIQRGEFQAAELQLLRCPSDPENKASVTAVRRLVELWDRMGYHVEAAGLLDRALQTYGENEGLDGVSLTAFASQMDERPQLHEAWKQRQPLPFRVSQVSIRETAWLRNEPRLTEAYKPFRRRFVLPYDSTVDLLEKSQSEESHIDLIDHAGGVVSGRFRIPTRNSFPSAMKNAQVGHLIPIGAPGEMLGLSLLETFREEPAWRTTTQGKVANDDVMLVGPTGPGFCVFQNRHLLTAVDPATGRTLWRQTGIDPTAGLPSDSYTGLFGDEQVLVMFERDRKSYTVYRTATGQELRRGRLDHDSSQIRRAFGRFLFHIAQPPGGRRMRIWDAESDRMVFDEPAHAKIFTAVTPDRELVVIVPPDKLIAADGTDNPSRLKIIDVENNEVRLDLELPASELKHLNYIRAFRQRERYYVNFQRAVRVPDGKWFHYFASDTFLSVESMQGDVYAIDPEAGIIEWKRRIPARSVMRMPHWNLPFLVTFSSVRDRRNGGRRGLLVEVLDASTGETLAKNDAISQDRIVQTVYRRTKHCLELHGLEHVVEIKFPPNLQSLPNWEDGL